MNLQLIIHITKVVLLFALTLSHCDIVAQSPTFNIKGKVMDAETGEAIPFANIYFKGITKGTTSDLNGYYSFSTDEVSDSLTASYIGYTPSSIAFKKTRRSKRTINFKLVPQAKMLGEIEVIAGKWENPAWEILRNVVKHKKENNRSNIDSFHYESYVLTEIAINNISENLKKKKIFREALKVVEETRASTGNKADIAVPVFVSESLSDVYETNHPARRRENIKKSRITGIGINEEGVIAQIAGSTFQQFNFYDNWIRLLTKDFVSPIADGWRLYYDYELTEQVKEVDGVPCHKITFKPKNKGDLAFTGVMWITDEPDNFALKKIEVSVNGDANLNFIEGIKIEQDLSPLKKDDGSITGWMPFNTAVTVDVDEMSDKWAGMLAKSRMTNSKFSLQVPQENDFFERDVVMAEDALVNNDETFWQKNRHIPLTTTEQETFEVINKTKELPVVRSYLEIADMALYGYKNMGKFEIGPIAYLYASNSVEKHRAQVGFRTNKTLSPNWTYNGYVAYGFEDQKLKGMLSASYIFNRHPWTIAGVAGSYDLQRIGSVSNTNTKTLFNASLRYGRYQMPYMSRELRGWIQRDISRGLRCGITFRHNTFDPLFDFNYQSPENERVYTSYNTSELIGELRYAPGERLAETRNNIRRVIRRDDRPIISLSYTYGIPNFLNSDFEYHKFTASFWQRVRLGSLGRLQYEIAGGFIPSTVPFPLLEVHLGNHTKLFYNRNSFNMMDFFEFASDRYASLRLTHSFEGALLNRIPLIKKLKWRSFITANALYGDISDRNNPTESLSHVVLLDDGDINFQLLTDEPYIEAGYGVENIFKFLKVDFLHRITYQKPDAKNFSIMLSAKLRL